MQKIPTIFERGPTNRQAILQRKTPTCNWVFAGEGVATKKYDGTCCRVLNGQLWKRREIKKGKLQPEEFVLADHDEVTGKTTGWMPVTDEKTDRWHVEAFGAGNWPDGTYELCGPKVQNNPEQYEQHTLIPHAEATQLEGITRSFEGLRAFLKEENIEGIVFHHPDGRMAKIKKRDFGLPRAPNKPASAKE